MVWLPRLWAAGVLAVLAVLITGLLRARALARSADPVTDRSWLLAVQRVAYELGLKRQVRLLRARTPVVPMTWGWFRPVLLIPSDADSWSAAGSRPLDNITLVAWPLPRRDSDTCRGGQFERLTSKPVSFFGEIVGSKQKG